MIRDILSILSRKGLLMIRLNIEDCARGLRPLCKLELPIAFGRWKKLRSRLFSFQMFP